MTEQLDSKTLLDKKAKLQAQIIAAQFSLAGENEEPKIAEHVLTLREQQARMEQQIAQLNKELIRVNGQIPALANGKHKMLLAAISAQRWYAIKNIPEVLYDSHAGNLWPAFHYGFQLPLMDAWNKGDFVLGSVFNGYWQIPLGVQGEAILNMMYLSYPRIDKLKDKVLYLGKGKYENSQRKIDFAVVNF